MCCTLFNGDHFFCFLNPSQKFKPKAAEQLLKENVQLLFKTFLQMNEMNEADQLLSANKLQCTAEVTDIKLKCKIK